MLKDAPSFKQWIDFSIAKLFICSSFDYIMNLTKHCASAKTYMTLITMFWFEPQNILSLEWNGKLELTYFTKKDHYSLENLSKKMKYKSICLHIIFNRTWTYGWNLNMKHIPLDQPTEKFQNLQLLHNRHHSILESNTVDSNRNYHEDYGACHILLYLCEDMSFSVCLHMCLFSFTTS